MKIGWAESVLELEKDYVAAYQRRQFGRRASRTTPTSMSALMST